MNAPIVFFAYNRPEHTARALTSLAKADGAQSTEIFIYSDGPKNPQDAEQVEAVRKICREQKGFAVTHLVENESNVGLAKNVISGVSKVIGEWGRVIVVEDDLEVSHQFIKYMNSALDFYDNRGVFSISGYTPDVALPVGYEFSTYMMHRNCSWGWATWRCKWEKVDWQVKSFDEFIRHPRRMAQFNECGDDLSPMLLRWKIGEIHSWSIRFCYAGFRAGEPTVYPRKSLVRNCGTDGSGTNMGVTNRYVTPLASGIGLSNLAPGVAPLPDVVAQFRKFYDTSLIRRVINFAKRLRYLLLG